MEKYICYNEVYGVSDSFDTKEECEEYIKKEYKNGANGEFSIYSYDSEMFPYDDPEIVECSYIGFIDNVVSLKSENGNTKKIYVLSSTDYINIVNEIRMYNTLEEAQSAMVADYNIILGGCDESTAKCVNGAFYCHVKSKSDKINNEWFIAEFEV